MAKTSGGQPGNDNARAGAEWRLALKRAQVCLSAASGDERPNARKGLDILANEVVKAAAAGERWALQEVGDRTDGKAHQSLSVTEGDEQKRLEDEEHVWGVVHPEDRDDE